MRLGIEVISQYCLIVSYAFVKSSYVIFLMISCKNLDFISKAVTKKLLLNLLAVVTCRNKAQQVVMVCLYHKYSYLFSEHTDIFQETVCEFSENLDFQGVPSSFTLFSCVLVYVIWSFSVF